MNHRYCIITAGGAGTRFWPVSKVRKPKQFLKAEYSDCSFLQHTYDRVRTIIPEDHILIVTAERYESLVKEQIPGLKKENLLLEPYSRNTAPCLAYATYTLLKRDPEAEVIVSPSDQIIRETDLFADAVGQAFDFLKTQDALITLGITPTRPDSNYGYIQCMGGKSACKTGMPARVKTFTEKPDKNLAKVFMATGEFFWNSGIFVWRAATFMEEMEKYLPEVTSLFAGWENVLGTNLENEFIQRAFTDCINISVDYAVMSKTEKAWIFPAKFDWNDIGNWCSLYDCYPKKDEAGNLINTEAKIIEKTSGTMALSCNKKKLIAIKGLENFMVIDTEDALVICPKDEKDFKEFISSIAMPEFEKYR